MGADGSAYLHSMLMRQLLIWSSQYIPAGQHLNHHQIFVYLDKILSFSSLYRSRSLLYFIIFYRGGQARGLWCV